MRLLKALVVAATTLSAIAGPIRFSRRDQDPNILVLRMFLSFSCLPFDTSSFRIRLRP